MKVTQHVIVRHTNVFSCFLPVAPKIIMPDTVTVRAGSKMVVEALVAGKPAPFCKWKQGNEDVLTSDRLAVVKTLTTCTLIIKNVNRNDSGYYSLSAENSTSKVNQILRVTVMGQYRKSPLTFDTFTLLVSF